MSEATLSSLHLSEIGINKSHPSPPPPVPASLPQPDLHPAAVNDTPGSPPDINMMDVEVPTLTAEEIDEEILNIRTTHRPPTLEEIYRYARYGVAADSEEDDGRVNPDDDLLSQPSSRSSASDDEFDIPPGNEHGMPEDSEDCMLFKMYKLQMEHLSPTIAAATPAYVNAESCHHCSAPCFKPDGKPAKLFHYLPILPQIKALYAGAISATQMQYRSKHHDNCLEDEEGQEYISNIYDGNLYKTLRDSFVTVNGHTFPYKYFQEPQDVYLTGMTDGFQLFKKGKHTAWPLLFINNNLSPAERYKTWNVICVGLIPGPRKPKEHDSFMYVVAEDLAKAAIGTRAYNAVDQCMFMLRVYSPLKCGDMPAVASAYSGEGIRIIDSSNQSYYLPITCPPEYPPLAYTLKTLPNRSHTQYLAQAKEVDQARTLTERRQLAQLYGINYTPITSRIPGITFPWSFPFDFMHLLENMFKNYISLFAGNFKRLGDGSEPFSIAPHIWAEIGTATAKANATIPSSLGAAFQTSLKNNADVIAKIRIFYQYKTERLPTCVQTVHTWLHLVDIMEQSGLLWSYWCWVMERFCGKLVRAVSSRKYPYSSLNRRILELQTLHAIRHAYNLGDRIPPSSTMFVSEPPETYHNADRYDELTLLHPKRTLSFARDDLNDLRRRIAIHLATVHSVSVAVAMTAVPATIVQWGRARIKDADVVHSHIGYPRQEENQRNATFIQYKQQVDRNARWRRREVDMETRTFFGRLDRIIVCEVLPNQAMGILEPEPLVLLDVKLCNAERDAFGFYEYSTFRYSEISDGTCLRALVGRILDHDKWVFVRRQGAMENAEFVDEE
ncbi:hypothetical protein FRC04_003462 [Tulasnella sp. 424]|nr:hypothetical protein FRC04_003462 [Tulasnella sp. 424]KAG8965726.1 hypothetical protein FRC05_003043 [Tulasnella sp. 425]